MNNVVLIVGVGSMSLQPVITGARVAVSGTQVFPA